MRTRLSDQALAELRDVARRRLEMPSDKYLCHRYHISRPWLAKLISRMRRELGGKCVVRLNADVTDEVLK